MNLSYLRTVGRTQMDYQSYLVDMYKWQCDYEPRILHLIHKNLDKDRHTYFVSMLYSRNIHHLLYIRVDNPQTDLRGILEYMRIDHFYTLRLIRMGLVHMDLFPLRVIFLQWGRLF